jgi:ADP-heptose:LPS heptosyltransferase
VAEDRGAANGSGTANPARILLVRLDGLGDTLACIPALEGLRRVYPDATFGAVLSPANAGVFSDRVEHTYEYDLRRAGDHDAAGVEARLRDANYTHAIVATEEPVGYRLARGSGALRRAGFWHRLEKPLKSMWQYAQLTDRVYRPAAWIARPEHEAQTLYRLATAFGAPPPPPDGAGAMRAWLAVGPAPDGQSRSQSLGVQIGAKLATDGWGPAVIAAFCAAALRASGLRALTLLAAPSDQGLAHAVMEQLDSDVREHTSCAPSTGLPLWLRNLDSLAALIAPDSGAAHAAGMLGVPVIDLFGLTRFDQLSRQWRPWAAPSACFVKPPAATGTPSRLGEQVGAEIVRLRPLDRR